MNKCTDVEAFPNNLPVTAVLQEVLAASQSGPVVVCAPPGSGKTLLVPAAIHDSLLGRGTVVLVQPRRFAARAIARQIATMRGCRLGEEVGYRVRFDSRVSQATTLCVQTTGVLLRQLVTDPTLSDVTCVVLDEFHERSLDMDLLLGMLKRLREAGRPDLSLVIMSATLDAGVLTRFLDGAKVITANARLYPVEVTYAKNIGSQILPRNLPDVIQQTIPKALRETSGHVLIFLPGVGEIFATAKAVEADVERAGHRLVKLFGDLPAEQQDEALQDDGRRKIILATNIAETSVTIPGVTGVIDSGLARQLHVSSATGLPQLQTLAISQASADQRAGRAGRTIAGRCWRLWNEAAHQRRPQFERPEVLRADLTQAILLLKVLDQAEAFPWLDEPSPEFVTRGYELLVGLGCVHEKTEGTCLSYDVTDRGRDIASLPVHPRLASLLIEGARAGVLHEVSLAAALLTERDPFRAGGRPGSGPRDLIEAHIRSDLYEKVRVMQHFKVERTDVNMSGLPPIHFGAAQSVLRAAQQYAQLASQWCGPQATDSESSFRQVFLTAFPDRLCRVRAGSAERGTMVGGRGVRLDKQSSVRHEKFFVAIDIDDSNREVTVRCASAVEPQWLTINGPLKEHLSVFHDVTFNQARKKLEGRRKVSWHGLILEESPQAIEDDNQALDVLFEQALRKPIEVLPEEKTEAAHFLLRARWLRQVHPGKLDGPAENLDRVLDTESLLHHVRGEAHGFRSFEDIRNTDWMILFSSLLGDDGVALVNRLAPVHCALHNGKKYKIEYAIGKQPEVRIRIQELFGVVEIPGLDDGEVALTVQLLGPNNKPQQRTDNLMGFWLRTYPSVRKEMKHRYPKHAWPEDPTVVVQKKVGRSKNA
ncbi:ATP-dependent helicase HrpB [Pirellulales bacterium]|nr:ATP-dependent helicase HrpB [Pirellulales bacterium]